MRMNQIIHIFMYLLRMRAFTEDGSWGNKQKREYVLDEDGNRIKDARGKDIFNAVSTTGWNDPELLKEWRRAWTEKVNEKFRECHMAARIDHRSYKEQGIDLIPTIHEGYEVRAMEKKGIKTINRGTEQSYSTVQPDVYFSERIHSVDEDSL